MVETRVDRRNAAMKDEYVRKATVLRVVDGDTIDALAKAYLDKLLMEHPNVTLRTVKTKEKWGRYLAEVEFVSGTEFLHGGEAVSKTCNVSTIMLAEGYAKEYVG
jgi:endonuclease YncB( thermonuclease family)